MYRSLSLLLLSLPLFCSAQFLDETFGGAANDRFDAVTATSNGNVLAVGRYSTVVEDPSPWMVKTNSAGEPLFDVVYETVGLQSLTSCAELADGSFVAVGLHQDGGFQPSYGLVMRVSSDGDLIWSETFGTEEGARLDDVIVLDDGTIMALGTFETGGDNLDDLWMLSLDIDGQELNSWLFGSLADEGGTDLVKLENGFALSGSGINPDTESYDATLIRVNQDMEMISQVWYGTPGIDYPRELLVVGNDSLVCAGFADPNNDGVSNGFFMKSGSNGIPVIYETFVDGLNHATIDGIVALADGTFYTSGTHNGATSNWDFEALHLSSEGQELESTLVVADGFDYGLGITRSETHIFMCGITDSFGAGAQDGWLLGFDQPTNLTELTPHVRKPFPNPATTSFSLNGLSLGDTVSVFDQTGRMLHQTQLSGNALIDCSSWTPGVYILQAGGGSQRIVVQ